MYDEEGISIAIGIIFITAVVWVPIVDFVSKKYSKRLSWLIFASLYLVANIFLYLFVHPGNDITLYIVFFFMSVMALVPYQIGWSIIPDCVEIDEYKTGARREGLYYGTANVIQKGGSALAIFIAGLLLQKVGYNTELAAQTAETMDGVRLILVGGTAILTILGIIFLAIFPLTKAKHGAIVNAIEARKNGEVVDESSFKDCIR